MAVKFVITNSTPDGMIKTMGPFNSKIEALNHCERVGITASACISPLYPVAPAARQEIKEELAKRMDSAIGR